MAVIQDLLKGKNESLSVQDVVTLNPWIVSRGMKCILSPDSDGLLCGLFMSAYMGWEVIGFYDGKVCLIREDCSCYDDDVCFLDMEIYRQGIKSMGHHMVSVYNSSLPDDWDSRFRHCIQPNLIRGYDRNSFRLKYPLATIHMLIRLVEESIGEQVDTETIFPLLFTDGTYTVMTSYPENVMNWWKFLGVDESALLTKVFKNDDYPLYVLMQEMDEFFRLRDAISIVRERGDRLKISNKDSTPYNIVGKGEVFGIEKGAVERCEKFVTMLSDMTGWEYHADRWSYSGFRMMQFTKSNFTSEKWSITKKNWNSFLEKNPLSWAMTSGGEIEFTLEYPSTLY